MGTGSTWGSASLGPSGLVAVMSCGHWWVYPGRASAEQPHEVARFNHSLRCGVCLDECQMTTDVPVRGTVIRVN